MLVPLVVGCLFIMALGSWPCGTLIYGGGQTVACAESSGCGPLPRNLVAHGLKHVRFDGLGSLRFEACPFQWAWWPTVRNMSVVMGLMAHGSKHLRFHWPCLFVPLLLGPLDSCGVRGAKERIEVS